jgi:hypothetical protein
MVLTIALIFKNIFLININLKIALKGNEKKRPV